MTFSEDAARDRAAAALGTGMRQARVVQRWPLLVRIDGDLTNDTPAWNAGDGLLVADRVYGQFDGQRFVVLGRIKTAIDQWTTPTLINGWTTYDAANVGYAQPAYRRIGDQGELIGHIKHATLTTVGAVLTLPTALRPVEAHTFVVFANPGIARIMVKEAVIGTVEVTAYIASGGAGLVGLSGIHWPLPDPA